jgi:hypothetical protein
MEWKTGAVEHETASVVCEHCPRIFVTIYADKISMVRSRVLRVSWVCNKKDLLTK